MASASLARAGFLRSGSYQPRNMASSCGVSPLHPVRRFDAVTIPEHTFFFQQVIAYVRSTKGVSLRSRGAGCASGGVAFGSGGEGGRRGFFSTSRLLDSSTTLVLAVLPSCRLAVSL